MAVYLSEVPTDSDSPQLEITMLLNRMQHGDRQAGQDAAALIYNELHRIAAREMRRERPDHTLQTTALVHEAYMRLAGSQSLEIHNRKHFFAVASQQMRRILVDHARAAGAQRRGADAPRVPLDQVQIGAGKNNIDVLLLDESLSELAQIEPRAAQVVELKFFGGFTDNEVGEASGVSLATVRRDWEFARSWLFNRMRKDHRVPGAH